MADKKISALTSAATPLAGTEMLPVVQSNTTKKVSVNDLTAGKNVSASSVTVDAGTVSAPTVTTAGDANTGIFFPAADTIAFTEGGVESVRITSSGTVGIGTISPATGLDVQVGTNANGQLRVGTANQAGLVSFRRGGDGVVTGYIGWGGATDDTNFVVKNTSGGGTVKFEVGAAERMRVDEAGAKFITSGYEANPNGARVGYYTDGVTPQTYIQSPANGATVFWSPASDENMRVTGNGNLGLGTSSFGTSAKTVFSIKTGTAPTTGPADTIQIYSSDLSAGNTILSLFTEGTPVNANVTAAATHRIAISINGTVYYLLANTSP